MKASEAARLVFKRHKLPEIVKKIELAIEKGESRVRIPKSSIAVDVFEELGYTVEPEYSGDYEMRVEGYFIIIPGME